MTRAYELMVILDGDLDPSTGDGANESTATLSVYEGAGAEWADSGDDVTVTNRDDGFCGKAGEYLIAVKLGSGEYRPLHFPPILRLGKTDAAHNKGASGTVSIPGSLANTNTAITVRMSTGPTVQASSSFVAPWI